MSIEQQITFVAKIRKNNDSFVITVPKAYVENKILELSEYEFIVKEKKVGDTNARESNTT